MRTHKTPAASATALCLLLVAIPAAGLVDYHIEREARSAHTGAADILRRLAADDFMGRDNLTEGSELAQEYLVPILQEIGPGLVSATVYRQPFPDGTNLLAIIPGRELPDEYVIVGGHYDHHGFSDDPVDGDDILNGATDNAAGAAAAATIGRAIRELPEAPRRSVIIALWDTEEDGLLGADYYVKNPLVPIEQTAAYINFDILGQNLTPALARTTFSIGAETGGPALQELVIEATRDENGSGRGVDLDVVEFSYIFGQGRSDYAPFVAAGVPTVFFSDANGPCWHTVDDENEIVDFEKFESQVRLAFRVAVRLAEQEDRLPYVPLNPNLATYEDAVGLLPVLQRAKADIGLFSLDSQDFIRTSSADITQMVADGPDAFDGTDVGVVLAVAADAQTRIQADLPCVPMFPVAKRSPVGPPRRGFGDTARRVIDTRVPRRLPRR